jgi:TatD DNase family protein
MARCREAGVRRIVNIGIEEATSRAALRLADAYPEIYAAVGWHPADCPTFDRVLLLEMLAHPKVRALGEIGLDYFRDHHPRELQIRVFEEQVAIAKDRGLPIVVHNREAHDDCLSVLESHKPGKVVFHCYSGDEKMAERIFANGWTISFTGAITYKNNKYGPVVAMTPEDRYMVETDCPFLTPVPYRGKRNAPYYLPLVIAEIARLRGITPEEAADQTWRNGLAFFDIPGE